MQNKLWAPFHADFLRVFIDMAYNTISIGKKTKLSTKQEKFTIIAIRSARPKNREFIAPIISILGISVPNMLQEKPIVYVEGEQKKVDKPKT